MLNMDFKIIIQLYMHSYYVIDANNYISQSLDNGKFTMGIFVDIRKAFDIVEHNILLQKLEFYGLRRVSNDFLGSYLKQRSQFVSIKNVDSNLEPIRCGVLQGSILGPLLFNLYINDMVNVSKQFKFILFADDTKPYLQ